MKGVAARYRAQQGGGKVRQGSGHKCQLSSSSGSRLSSPTRFGLLADIKLYTRKDHPYWITVPPYVLGNSHWSELDLGPPPRCFHERTRATELLYNK